VEKEKGSNYAFFDSPSTEGFRFGFLPSSNSAFDRVSREVRHLLISLRNARAFSEFSFVEFSMFSTVNQMNTTLNLNDRLVAHLFLPAEFGGVMVLFTFSAP
jgi:hypothetical protein